MKIAYVTSYDSSNEHAWSGSGYHMWRSLESAGCQVERFGKLHVRANNFFKLKKGVYKYLLSKNYQKDREPVVLKGYAEQLSNSLSGIEHDVILSPSSLPVAYLRGSKPIVFWTDATFASLINFFPDFTNVPKESIDKGNQAEQAALDNCALAIYSSAWAAESAVQNYRVDAQKIKVVPFGANIAQVNRAHEVGAIVEAKTFDVCRLLFVGVDWKRKGGDLAIAVAGELNKAGLPTELHIVGTTPPGDLPSFVVAHGFLSKKDQNESGLIDSLYKSAHFLLLPSIADCVPVVIAEASSYALPSISTDVGGIKSAITNDVNGFTFGLSVSPPEYAKYIEATFRSRRKYTELCVTTHNEFRTRLNWETAGKTVKNLIEQLPSLS